jgi:hypothetical protein
MCGMSSNHEGVFIGCWGYEIYFLDFLKKSGVLTVKNV